jgi:uncharacterized SAM-binding protein YcdF (DUF218 family)
MPGLASSAAFLISPLAWAIALLVLGATLVAVGRPRRGGAVVTAAILGLWLASSAGVAGWLASGLERRHPAVAPAASPSADAIVLLGGTLAGAFPPLRPTFHLSGPADRVWHAAALYRAGKSPLVLISGGERRHVPGLQTEAEAVHEMLTTLGVPPSAIRVERSSRTTSENAAYTRGLLRELKIGRVLLVTSAQHMPRAMKTFERAWAGSGVQIMPATTDVEVTAQPDTLADWLLPHPGALLLTTRSLKEYAGLLLLAII